MSIARSILIALICASPVIVPWDGLMTQGLLAGGVSIALSIAALSLRPGEIEFLVSIVRPLAIVAAVPVLWIAFQVLPLRPLAHPIWASTEAALGRTITETISIDPGASLISLGQCLVMSAAAFLSAAVAIDRGRAESLLFALTAATAAIALLLMGHGLFASGIGFSPFLQAQAIDCVAIGAVVAASACIRTIERYETRRTTPQRSVPILLWTFTRCGAAFLICALALLSQGTRALIVATACGLATLALIVIIRRIGLGGWRSMAAAIPMIGLVFLVATQPTEPMRSTLLVYADSPPPLASAVDERVLDDAPLVGTGAGTFAAIAPIYRGMDDPPPDSVAMTTAATLAIELGRPMLWLIVVATLLSILFLIRASLQRGRDSFYPAMGASCLIVLLLVAFVNAGLLGNAASLITAAALGLALAQSKSRTTQPL